MKRALNLIRRLKSSRLLTPCLVLLACLGWGGVGLGGVGVSRTNANGQTTGGGWQAPKALIASTPARRAKALKKLGFGQGEWTLALLSIDCQECEPVARGIETLPGGSKAILVAAPPAGTRERVQFEAELIKWRSRLTLINSRVIKADSETLEDLGAVLFPSVLKVKAGAVAAAREDAP